jgi:hypothetical protein
LIETAKPGARLLLQKPRRRRFSGSRNLGSFLHGRSPTAGEARHWRPSFDLAAIEVSPLSSRQVGRARRRRVCKRCDGQLGRNALLTRWHADDDTTVAVILRACCRGVPRRTPEKKGGLLIEVRGQHPLRRPIAVRRCRLLCGRTDGDELVESRSRVGLCLCQSLLHPPAKGRALALLLSLGATRPCRVALLPFLPPHPSPHSHTRSTAHLVPSFPSFKCLSSNPQSLAESRNFAPRADAASLNVPSS